jgi:hypothetical protein
MVPLLVTALIGVGVKIATDLLMAGAKDVVRAGTAGPSFATTLEKARAAPAAAGVTMDPRTSLPDAGLAERSRLLAIDGYNAVPPAARAHGAASYRRLGELAPSM